MQKDEFRSLLRVRTHTHIHTPQFFLQDDLWGKVKVITPKSILLTFREAGDLQAGRTSARFSPAAPTPCPPCPGSQETRYRNRSSSRSLPAGDGQAQVAPRPGTPDPGKREGPPGPGWAPGLCPLAPWCSATAGICPCGLGSRKRGWISDLGSAQDRGQAEMARPSVFRL